jgi:CBS domain-containing protein
MDTSPPTIGPTVTIHDAVFGHLVHRGTRALPVCEGDRLLGIISVSDLKDVPQQTWRERLVLDEMTRAPLKSLAPDDPLYDALSLLGESRIHQAPVMVDDRLVGLLSRAHIIQYFHQMGELGVK